MSDSQTQNMSNLSRETDEATQNLIRYNQQVRESSRNVDENTNSLRNNSNQTEEQAKQTEEAKEKIQELAKGLQTLAENSRDAMKSFAIDSAKAIVDFGTDFENVCGQVEVTSGATDAQMEAFGQTLKDVYSGGFGEDMQDVADALAAVQSELGEGIGDAGFQQATEQALTLRDALGLDVADSVQSAKTMMQEFGLSSSEAFGMMALGVQNGLNGSGELLASVDQYAGAFSALGLNAQDMFGIFQSGVESGALSMDAVGAAMQTFSDNVLSGTAAVGEQFAGIGLNADEMTQKFAAGGEQARDAFYEVVSALAQMEDPVARNQAGAELFGDAWETLGPQVTSQLDNIRTGYDDAAAAMDGITEGQMNGLGSVFTEIGRTMQTEFLAPIADSLMPILEEAGQKIREAFQNEAVQLAISSLAEAFADMVKGIGEFISNNMPMLLEGLTWFVENGSAVVSAFAGIATALGVLKIAEFVTGLINGFGLLQAALGALGGPITLIIAGIAAITATLATLWNTNEGFREGIINAWNAISETVGSVAAILVGFFTETLPAAWNQVVEFFSTLPEQLGAVWELVAQVLSDGWNAIAAFFTEAIPAWLASMGEWFAQLPVRLQEVLTHALQTAQEWGANLLTFVTEAIPQVIDSVVTWFMTLPERIGQFLSQVLTGIQEWGGSLMTNAAAAAQGFLTAVVTTIQQLPANIGTHLQAALQKLSEWGTQMLTTGKQKAGEVVTGVAAALQQLPGKVVAIGGDVVKGVWSGITNMAGWIKDRIAEWCGSFVQGFKNALGIHSPSRVMRDQVGTYIGEGVAVGLDQSKKRVRDSANAMQDTILATFDAIPASTAQNQPIVVQTQQADTGGLLSELRAIRALVAEGKVIAVDRQKLCEIVTDGQRQRAIASGRTVIPV